MAAALPGSSEIVIWYDSKLAFKTLSVQENGYYHTGAVDICATIFLRIQNQDNRAQFYLNCYELGLRGWKLYSAYQNHCKGVFEIFFRNVQKCDQEMMEALKIEEQAMIEP